MADNPDFNTLGDFYLDFVTVFLDLGDLAHNPALGNNLITAAQCLDHSFMFFHLLLLGPDHQKIHDSENKNDGKYPADSAAKTAAGRLCICW